MQRDGCDFGRTFLSDATAPISMWRAYRIGAPRVVERDDELGYPAVEE